MSASLTQGVLAISVDLELDLELRGVDQTRSLEAVTRDLIALFKEHRLTATWAVADPAVSAATERVMTANPAHEMAILGDRTWVGREAGRTRFSRELTRRVSRGRSAGLSIASLVLRDAELDDHLDLVVKQGIRAIAGGQAQAAPASFGGATQSATPLRFGLWNIATQMAVPGERPMFSLRSTAGLTARAIDRAIKQQTACHVSISGLEVAALGRRGLRTVEQIARHAARRSGQQSLVVMPLAALADRLAGVRTATPARSILQPAA